MEKGKKIRRLPPCPGYDIAGIESWLEDMALEGLFPAAPVSFFPCVTFSRSAPKALRYRLEPMQKTASIWDPTPAPPQEMLELARECGWEYAGRQQRYFLYCTSDPNARELNTEPEVQALSLNVLKKSSGKIFLSMAVYLLLLGCLLTPGVGQNMVTYGSGYILLLFLLLAASVLENGFALWKIHLLQKQLRSGNAMSHHSNWRKGAAIHRATEITQYVLLAVLVCCWIRYGAKNLGLYAHPLAEYPGLPPFATLDTLQEENPEVRTQRINNAVYESWSDLLFPVCITWLDGGSISYEDGASYGGLLEVQYCEALSPWLAESVAKGYLKAYGASDIVSLEALGLDYAASFTGYHGLPRAVLVEGNTVICVRFSMGDPEGVFTLENWIRIMAERLRTDT